jgi:hypothetical protein
VLADLQVAGEVDDFTNHGHRFAGHRLLDQRIYIAQCLTSHSIDHLTQH